MSRFSDIADRALEWSVVGSFTRAGSTLRRRLDHWEPFADGALAGRVIVLTGGTSGLGLEAVRTFARLGATIEIIARSEAKARATCEDLRREARGAQVSFVVADMGDLAAVRAASAEVLRRHSSVYALIHNAGALEAVRHVGPQGLELTVASQVVGPFLLTGLLLPALKAVARSRVLWVSSGGMYSEPLSVDALEMSDRDYDGTTAYARAKRAQVTLSALLAERLSSAGIAVQCMHPGWADTPGVARSLPTFRALVGPLLRTAAEGADTLVWLTVDDGDPLSKPGRFWLDRRERPLHRLASTRSSDTPEERRRLWEWVVAKGGVEI